MTRLLPLLLTLLLTLPSVAADLRPIPGERSYTAELDAAIRQAEGGVLTIHPGVYTISPAVIDEPVTIIGHGATLIVRQDWTDRRRHALTLAAEVTVEGLTIVAGGSYSAVSVESPGCVLEDVRVLDYSYKGVRVAFNDAEGGFIAERCHAASDRGNGSAVFASDGRYPLAYQVDAGPGRMIGRVRFTDCSAGPHPASKTHGPSIKIATVHTAIVEGFRVVGQIDPINGHTLIVGEDVGRLTVRDSELPRGITHYPDPAGVADVGYMLVANTGLGGDHAPGHLHDHLHATRLVYRDVRVRGIDITAIKDETHDGRRRFDGCSFASTNPGKPQVMWAHADYTPTITATDTTATGLMWSVRGDIAQQFGGAQ